MDASTSSWMAWTWPTAIFFVGIAGLLALMTRAGSALSPGGEPRVGILRYRRRRAATGCSSRCSARPSSTSAGSALDRPAALVRARSSARVYAVGSCSASSEATARADDRGGTRARPSAGRRGSARRRPARMHLGGDMHEDATGCCRAAALAADARRASPAFAGMDDGQAARSTPSSRTSRRCRATSRIKEMQWFIDAAKPFAGMEINVVSETHHHP